MFDYIWFFINDRNAEQRKLKYLLLTKARGGNVKSMAELAKICQKSNDSVTALKWYGKIVQLGGPNSLSALNNIGNIHYVRRNFQEAINFYRRAANNGLTVAKKNMGIVYQECEMWDDAIVCFEAAAREGDQGARARLEKLKLRPRLSPIYTWQEAEHLAQRWMFYFGFHDAKLTRAGSDGGVDVNSNRAIAQVKFEKAATGRPKLQELAGIAHDQGKAALFFSLSGYTKNAIQWAEQSRIGIALFRYDNSGKVIAVNNSAEQLIRNTTN
jgi:TPR repeat protein